MIKRLFEKLKTLRLYFVSGSYNGNKKIGLQQLKDKKYGYGITWCDEP